jgi:transposase
VHLDEIAGAVSAGAHAVVLLDQAGWHTTAKLQIPGNLSLLPLPPRSPELNPAENLWQFLRQTFLSNRVFKTYDAILEAACHASNAIIEAPSRITSIGLRDWARTGQC